MKPDILARMSEIAELSSGARLITDRFLAATAASAPTKETSDAAAVVTDLRNQITMLDQRVRQLSEALEDAADVTLTDEQAERFRADFRTRISDTPSPQLLAAYDHQYFQTTPRSLRAIVATILVDLFDQRSQRPAELWHKLSLTDGAL